MKKILPLLFLLNACGQAPEGNQTRAPQPGQAPPPAHHTTEVPHRREPRGRLQTRGLQRRNLLHNTKPNQYVEGCVKRRLELQRMRSYRGVLGSTIIHSTQTVYFYRPFQANGNDLSVLFNSLIEFLFCRVQPALAPNAPRLI